VRWPPDQRYQRIRLHSIKPKTRQPGSSILFSAEARFSDAYRLLNGIVQLRYISGIFRA
jgi:hypothetical protein